MAAGLGAKSNNNTDPQNQKTLADFDPQKKPKRNLYASGAAILASMTSILLGYGKLTLQEPFLVSISISLLYIVIHETCIMEMEVIRFLCEENLLRKWISFVWVLVNLTEKICLN